MKTRLLIALGVLLAGTGSLRAASVKVYGVQTQADLTVLTPATNNIAFSICNRSGDACGQTSVTWAANIVDDGKGNVKKPSGEVMNAQGWMLADQYVKITSVVDNTPSWSLAIYTDNTNKKGNYTGTLYTGPFSRLNTDGTPKALDKILPGVVNGLVSKSATDSTINGQFLIPLSWRLLTATTGYMAEEVPFFGFCDSTQFAYFKDFSTHYMVDLFDQNPCFGAPSNTWWEYMPTDTQPHITRRLLQRNYESLFTSEGVGITTTYRTPFPTLTTPYYLYMGAKFAPGTVNTKYGTTVFLEFLTT